MTDRSEPRPGFYAACDARNDALHAYEALTLDLHGREWDISRQLADAEKYLRKALDYVAEARAAREADERGTAVQDPRDAQTQGDDLMTICQSFHRTDMDPHAYVAPRFVEPYQIDLMRLQFHANRMKHFAAGKLVEDREQAAREAYAIADLARDLAEQFEQDVKEADQ